jgi:hypothetical protein
MACTDSMQAPILSDEEIDALHERCNATGAACSTK